MSTTVSTNDVSPYTALNKVLSTSFKSLPSLKKMISSLLKTNNNIDLSNINYSIKSVIAMLAAEETSKPSVIIVPDISSALKFYTELSIISTLPVKLFSTTEYNPYEMIYSSASSIKDQFECLDSLLKREPSIIIATAKSIMPRLMPHESYETFSAKLSQGEDIDLSTFPKTLSTLGYTRTSIVLDPGEYSIRGDICDIYPISGQPVRIETGFDEIESIKLLDTQTQRSGELLDNIVIRPRYRTVLTTEKKETLLSTLESILKSHKETLENDNYYALQEFAKEMHDQAFELGYFEGIEYFLTLLSDHTETFLDYCPPNTLFIIDEFSDVARNMEVIEEKFTTQYKKGVDGGRIFPLATLNHFSEKHILESFERFQLLNLSALALDETDCSQINYTYVPTFHNNLQKVTEYIKEQIQRGIKVVITTEYTKRVLNTLTGFGIDACIVGEDSDVKCLSVDVLISRAGLSNSFLIEDAKISSITDFELFGKPYKRPTISKKESKREDIDYLLSPTDLKEGDYVVHAKHGIGRFVKLQTMSIDNQEREYLSLEYRDQDKLYVPVDQINWLSRYRGVGEAPPKLSKMGGAEWDKVQRKTKKAVEDIAAELLNLYAHRSKVQGYPFEPDTAWQTEMEDSFEYIETPDQLKAIVDVKKDMESELPMDRLICGDVGYGKTEVALRAVFKAVLSGKQVAFLVPTTVLAQQHYKTLKERFLPYPITIEVLSRFCSPKDQKSTINKLVTGECDIVVGTHKIIQKKVVFKNLGLVVIDEEHKFGVKHKEYLKQLRSEVDVISMSATPIPRTLYMALSGIRHISVINTPPVNRLPIKTYVGEFNKSLVRTAIYRELERNGQVFFVHNRVQTIYKTAQALQEIVPDAKIAIGHGQMTENDLEKVIYEFGNRDYDILVCTTIIESGLDMPNVNTIIIDNAEQLGLAQLYQLRGRVGRSDRQAYAYCLYHPKKYLTPEARKRLTAIREFNTLGSGYQIALRDLEIRGIGNILGSKQHGHMISVGFDLYCQMLEDSIQELKGHKVEKKVLTIVDINVTAFIPDKWVGSKEQKIIEYKRLAAVDTYRELEAITEEWKDRFGKLPQQVLNLITIVKIRLLATDIGFTLIREESDCVRIFTNYDFSFWQKFSRQAPSHIQNKTTWVKMPATSVDGSSAILVKYRGFTPQHMLNFVEELCFYFEKYLRETKGDIKE